MSDQPPAARGANSAFARIDADGCRSAAKWLDGRMRKKGAEPLHPAYVKAYQAAFTKLCPTKLGRARARRRR